MRAVSVQIIKKIIFVNMLSTQICMSGEPEELCFLKVVCGLSTVFVSLIPVRSTSLT